MPTSAVAGIVLAAGVSSRMGRDKRLLEINGETLVRRAARRAIEGGLSPLIVVLDRPLEELAGLPCHIVINPDARRGMASSIDAGLRSIPASAPAAMIVLADMPSVTPEMIRTMIARYEATRAPLVVSEYGGVDAPPIIYDRSLFAEGCGQHIVRRHRGRAEIVPWPAAALVDLDEPDDYSNYLSYASH
jgi:molybdenum cofactor cytidylyltransferase